MFTLEQLLDARLLMKDKKSCGAANVFGFIAYTNRNPYIVKVLKDEDFWQSLHERTEGWILYAIKPESEFYLGGNANFVNDSLGIEPEQYPRLVILSIGSDGVMKQRDYPILDDSVDGAYRSIERNVEIVTNAVKKILPEYRGATSVSREVYKALDAELASRQWKCVSASLKSFVLSLLAML